MPGPTWAPASPFPPRLHHVRPCPFFAPPAPSKPPPYPRPTCTMSLTPRPLTALTMNTLSGEGSPACRIRMRTHCCGEAGREGGRGAAVRGGASPAQDRMLLRAAGRSHLLLHVPVKVLHIGTTPRTPAYDAAMPGLQNRKPQPAPCPLQTPPHSHALEPHPQPCPTCAALGPTPPARAWSSPPKAASQTC